MADPQLSPELIRQLIAKGWITPQGDQGPSYQTPPASTYEEAMRRHAEALRAAEELARRPEPRANPTSEAMYRNTQSQMADVDRYIQQQKEDEAARAFNSVYSKNVPPQGGGDWTQEKPPAPRTFMQSIRDWVQEGNEPTPEEERTGNKTFMQKIREWARPSE